MPEAGGQVESLLQLAILLWQNQTLTDGGRKVRSVYPRPFQLLEYQMDKVGGQI